MAAESLYYQDLQKSRIRRESHAIMASVLGFSFHFDSAMSSLNTIQAELMTLIKERLPFASKADVKEYDYMLNWLSSFFRMLNKSSSSTISYDFLFYGAALTINKFLDDHHL